MNAYNPLDYTYSYNVPRLTLNKTLLRSEVLISPTIAEVLWYIDYNDTSKNRIRDLINTHATYISGRSLDDRNIIHLWTNPPICDALQRILRGIVHNNSMDLENLTAVLEYQNGDILSRANDIRKRIRSVRSEIQKDRAVKDMLLFVLDRFVLGLSEIVLSSPSVPFQFVSFRGISGSITQRYTHLATNDIILERGFTSVTWQPLKAIEYAKGNGSNPPAYLMCVVLPINTRALSVYTVSAFPNDREFLLPAGTVLLKRPNGVFDVIGIYQKFLNRQNHTQPQYTGWLSLIDPTYHLDQTEADLIPGIMGNVHGNYRFGVINNPSNATTKRPTLFQRRDLTVPRPTVGQKKQHRDLPPGVTVVESQDINDNDPINIVDLDLHALFQTHTVETTVNEKGGITTFFMQNHL